MPLHLNLNHEVEKVRAERRRDPLKLSMMALGVVVAGFMAQLFWEIGKSASLSRQLSARKDEFAKLVPKAQEATKLAAELEKKLGNSNKLEKRIEGRLYWAPLLQEVIRTVPINVQITRFAGDAQGEALKKVQINLDGVSGGTEPRKVAEDFRQSLGEVLGKKYKNVSATFRHLEDGTDLVQVGGKSVPTATFAINIQLQSGEEATATPPPRVPKKR